MADQNNTDDKGKFYSEILSPSELFAARSRSHKIPVRGQKDFFPDDSDEQKRRLEQSLNEHWSLLSEERVERLGNLVKGEWIPSEQIVELQSPAGKFWQTMGFSANGKQCLLPEEALYLMECGNLQVFYQDLPLSIQDGYEKFLSANTVSLQQYQVFGHLKRLGYVVLRFDPSSESSSYARQLNLPQSRDRAGRTLKRKRSLSPTPSSTPTATCSYKKKSGCLHMKAESVLLSAGRQCELLSRAEAQEECSTEKMEEDKCNEGEEDKKLPEAQSSADEGGGRSWWMTDVLGDSDQDSGHGSKSVSSCWDFSSISFPDLGSTSREHFPGGLAPPDPSLLPGDLKVGFCDVGAWRQKINLRQVKMSASEQKKEKYRRRWDVNKNREVRRCRNWAEYQELMARRKGKREGRPAHLWNREVTPLHDPTQPIATGELLEKISVIKPTHLLEGASRLKDADDWRICFNVYQPDTVADFKKSNPGKPYSRMCVCSFDDPVPDLRAIKLLAYQSGDIPVVIAVVDYGDISFYTFKDFQLPTDVYP